MSQINPISETFQGTANSVYNLLYPGIINGPFSSNVLVNSVLQTAVTDYNIIANTLIFYTGKPDANIVVQHYTEDNATINLTNLIELSARTSSGTNANGFGTVNIGNSSDIIASTGNATLRLVGGEAIALAGNTSLNQINISATYLRNSDWVLRTPALNIAWQEVIWADKLNLFVAVSSNASSTISNNRIMTSPDGINWTIRQSPEIMSYTGLEYNGNVIVSVGQTLSTANQVMISTNAVTWQSIPAASPGIQWKSVTWNGNVFCAVAGTGVANSVMISTDGTTWSTRVPASDTSWIHVKWIPGINLFVALAITGTNNRVMTSPDGTTWTSRFTPVDNSWVSLAWNGRILVAVAFTGTNNRVMTSTDGINWTVRYTPIDNNWASVVWTGTQFIAVANQAWGTGTIDRIMTSPDGINWTVRPAPLGNLWRSIAWNGRTAVVVAQAAGDNDQKVMTSTYDDILQAGAGITLTGNSQANTMTLSVNVSNVTVGTLAVARGGTGQTTYANGEILIGNTISGGLDRRTITQGTGILITNGNGTITIDATGGAATDQYARDKANGAVQLGYPRINVAANASLVAASTNNDILVLIQGNGVVLVSNTANHSISISANISNTTPINYNPVTGNISHADSGVTATGYGTASQIPVFVVNQTGHVTSVTNTAIAGLAASVITTGSLVVARGGTGLSPTISNGAILIGNTVNSGFDLNTIANTGTGGILITNGQGTITLAANVIWMRGNLAAVTPLTYTASNGTFTHAGSGVTATGYGTSTQIPVFVVNETGHVTSVTNTAIAGLDAGVITTGRLVVARGGTGLTPTIVNGAILIGNTVNSGFDLNTISNTGSGGILITNGQGTITLGANVIWMRGNIGAVAPITYTASNGNFTHDGSGVTATGYGTANTIPTFVVNVTGHLTSALNVESTMSATIHQQTMSRVSLGF